MSNYIKLTKYSFQGIRRYFGKRFQRASHGRNGGGSCSPESCLSG